MQCYMGFVPIVTIINNEGTFPFLKWPKIKNKWSSSK